MSHPLLALESTHHQQWSFGRFSYLETPRPNHGLLLLLRGGIDYVNQERTLPLSPMDLVFLPQGCRYEARFHPGTEDLLVNFRIEGEAELPKAPCLILNDRPHTLLPLLERTVNAFAETRENYLEATGLFYRFCHQLTQQLRPTDPSSALISRAKALLSEPDCPSVDAVAKQLLLSPSGLRKKFKDAEGISPVRYRLLQKVENAKRQLLSTDLPISDIAEGCGFCDSAYFHKVFLRSTGLSPTAYRCTHKQL